MTVWLKATWNPTQDSEDEYYKTAVFHDLLMRDSEMVYHGRIEWLGR